MSYKLIKKELNKEVYETDFLKLLNLNNLNKFQPISSTYLNRNYIKKKKETYFILSVLGLLAIFGTCLMSYSVVPLNKGASFNAYIFLFSGSLLSFFAILCIYIKSLMDYLYLKKSLKALNNIFIARVKDILITNNYNNYPELLIMCNYIDKPYQWRVDYPNSVFKMFYFFGCILILCSLFNQINNYVINKGKI